MYLVIMLYGMNTARSIIEEKTSRVFEVLLSTIKADEMLGWHLLGIHNFAFYHRLMRDMRAAILRGDFPAFYEKNRTELGRSDEENVVHPVKKRRPVRAQHLGDYDIITSPEGYSSIRQLSSGEVMHSVNRPSDEAHRLYVEQSGLAIRLLKRVGDETELVIWDVGLGAASNAMAAVQCFEEAFAQYEIDLDPLNLAVKFASHFPHLRHGAPHALLEHGRWTHASGLLEWELHRGDFLAFLESAPVPDLIFYDPFSAKTDTGLWTSGVFARIHRHCRSKPAELYTYSSATAVRVSLLAAGFFVAEGVGTGPKTDTTLAFTRMAGAQTHPAAPKLLGAQWLGRWQRSSTKIPTDLTDEEKPGFEKRLVSHPQFSGLA